MVEEVDEEAGEGKDTIKEMYTCTHGFHRERETTPGLTAANDEYCRRNKGKNERVRNEDVNDRDDGEEGDGQH